MTSSEDDFAWTPASISDTMSSSDNDVSQLEYESESPKSYKVKLKKQLFQENSDKLKSNSPEKHQKKSKKKIKEEPPDDDIMSPRRKKVKIEPESDVDARGKRRKNRTLEIIENHDANDEAVPEYYNKNKIKEERTQKKERLNSSSLRITDHTFVNEESLNTYNTKQSKKKSKKKNKEFSEDPEIYSSIIIKEETSKKSNKITNNDISTSSSNDKLSKKHTKQSRNSDRDKSFEHTVDKEIDNEMDTSSTDVYVKKEKKKKKRSKRNSDFNDENNGISEKSEIIGSPAGTDMVDFSSILHSEKIIDGSDVDQDWECKENIAEKKRITLNYDATSEATGEQSEAEISNVVKNKDEMNKPCVENGSPAKTQRRLRISERIIFEEDEVSQQSNNESIQNEKSTNTQLDRYIKKHSHFTKVVTSKMPKDTIVKNYGDVWVVKIPKDVDINMLKGTKLVVDNKCKMKINGENYVGTVTGNEMTRFNFLSSEKGKFVITPVKINGLIQLHKRVPKPHFVQDNVIVDKHSFIPLPETKCRHPLFGPNYKAEMKIPKSVTERLKVDFQPQEQKKKKKSKRKEVEVSEEEIVKKKKKRKRKRSEDDNSASIPKRSKYISDSAEAWESERAIEENLFDF